MRTDTRWDAGFLRQTDEAARTGRDAQKNGRVCQFNGALNEIMPSRSRIP